MNDKPNNVKPKQNFFIDIPEEEFKKMQPEIDKYNNKSDFSGDTEGLTGEMLLELSTHQLKDNKFK